MLEELRTSIEAGHPDAVAALVIAADEEQRCALADLVMAAFPRPPRVRTAPPPGDAPYEPDTPTRDISGGAANQWEGALRVAGAGCLPEADAVVSWLLSDRFLHPPNQRTIDALVRVLQSPGRPSIEAVADGMATSLRPAGVDHQWPLIAALLHTADIPPPTTEAVLRGWLRALRFDDDPAGATERLRTDPWTWLLPYVFTIEGLGTELTPPAVAALAELCHTGGYERASMLSSLRWRLRVGDDSGDIRPFIALHDLLSPTVEEITAHGKEYLGLLTNPELRTAELALTTLRRADDAGPPATSIVADVARRVLLRPRPELASTLLKWLDTALTFGPPPLEVFEALTLCLHNESAEIVAQTRQILARHRPITGYPPTSGAPTS